LSFLAVFLAFFVDFFATLVDFLASLEAAAPVEGVAAAPVEGEAGVAGVAPAQGQCIVDDPGGRSPGEVKICAASTASKR
jgi:hypothetical protein